MPGEAGLSEFNLPPEPVAPVVSRAPIDSLKENETMGELKKLGYNQDEILLYWAARGLAKGRMGIGGSVGETIEDQRNNVKNFLTQRGIGIPPDDELEKTIVGILANPQNHPVLQSKTPLEIRQEETAGLDEAFKAAFEELGGELPVESVEEEAGPAEEPGEAGGFQEPEKQTPSTGEDADFAVNLNLIPEKERPFAKKLGKALWVGVKNWAKNLDPRGKNRAWGVGVLVGAAESAAFLAVPIPGLRSWAKAGINLAAAQGVYGITRAVYAHKRGQMERKFSGDESADPFLLWEEISENLKELEKGHGATMETVRDIFLGISAGATYVSATGLGVELGKEALAGMHISLPEIKFPTGKPLHNPQPVIIDETQPPVFIEAPTSPSGDAGLIDKLVQKKFAEITQAPKDLSTLFNHPGPPTPYEEFLTQKAAEVGKELPITDKFIEEALKAKGQMLSDLDAASLEKARLALQHALEAQANTSFDANLEVILKANPNLDLQTAINQAVAESHKSFETLLGLEQFQTHFSDVAQKAIAEQTALADALSMHISTGLEGQTKLFTDQAIKKGTTVGQLLIEKGNQVTWGAPDAKLFGAHIAANYDMLTDMWGKMADNKLIPDKPFPIGLTELADLVKKAEAGDLAAIEKLKLALHWIPAGEKFRILTAAGVKKTLELLR